MMSTGIYRLGLQPSDVCGPGTLALGQPSRLRVLPRRHCSFIILLGAECLPGSDAERICCT